MARLAPALILGIALATRLGFTLSLGSHVVQPDEGVYLSLARNIHENRVIGIESEPSADRPPALPLLVAGVYELFGSRVPAARVLNAMLGTLLVWLLLHYGVATFGERDGLVAAAIAALYPFFIYWSGVVMTETLTACLAVFALWKTQELVDAPSPGRAALAGVLWGLTALARTQNLGFALLLIATLPVSFALARDSRCFQVTACTAVFAVSALLLPGLWAMRNRSVTGSFVLDTHAGYTLIIRTMFHDQDRIDTSVAQQALSKTALYREVMALSPAQRNRAFTRAALRFIRDNPRTYLRNCTDNFIQLWRFYPRLDKAIGVSDAFLNRDRRGFALLSLATEPALILLGLAGLRFGVAERRPVFLPLLFIAFTTAIHTLVIAQMRYRIPVMPLVILLAAVGATRLYDRWRKV